MGLLNEASGWLAGMMQTAAAPPGPIIFTRGAGVRIDLTGKAWVGNTVFRRTPGDAGAAVVHGDRDYLIPAADLTFGGARLTPERGDRITETFPSGEVATYEVGSLPDEPEARPSDHERTVWRVHCKYDHSTFDVPVVG